MCGIVGYVGPRKVTPILLEGLKRLEYRGYDSAGIVYQQDGKLIKHRSEGKLSNLEEILDKIDDMHSHIGLGHTRWATHGAPSKANAHPHSDCTGELVIVHNGIIENYQSLRASLIKKGHRFTSETDTEVLAHLIEEQLDDDLAKAVQQAVKMVDGSFALGVIWNSQPDILVAARNQSPLVLGIQEGGGCFLASDIPAILPYTKEMIFLEDGEIAILRADEFQIRRLSTGRLLKKKTQTIQWNAGMAEKSGYKHFMLKEIYEQPQAVLNTFRGRLEPETGKIILPELGLSKKQINSLQRITLVACGTSWHAALVAKYWFEKLAGLPVEVDIASEFRYRQLLLDKNVLVIPISQSGETADTLAGLRLAKKLHAKVVSICNVVGSTITREADGTIYTHAGPEIGVASTKAFTSQLTALFLLTLYLAQARKTISQKKCLTLVHALLELPAIIENEIPRLQQETGEIAQEFEKSRDFLFIGRGLHFPIALEGALKLKEISYIHAEGYAAGELKHGPIALIDREMPVLGLAPKGSNYQKVISNIEEVKARLGRLILVGTKGDKHLKQLSDQTLFLPKINEELSPILYTIPLQLLAYEIARLRGCDVDQPRNLAKSVTVE